MAGMKLDRFSCESKLGFYFESGELFNLAFYLRPETKYCEMFGYK